MHDRPVILHSGLNTEVKLTNFQDTFIHYYGLPGKKIIMTHICDTFFATIWNNYYT